MLSRFAIVPARDGQCQVLKRLQHSGTGPRHDAVLEGLHAGDADRADELAVLDPRNAAFERLPSVHGVEKIPVDAAVFHDEFDVGRALQ